MKIKLFLPAVDGGPFRCAPAEEVELPPERILANNPVFPGEFNPHKVRLWVIGNEYGAIGAVWADHEQEAFDELVDAGLGESLLLDEEAVKEAGEDARKEALSEGRDPDEAFPDFAHLGNAGEPADLEHAWIREVRLAPEDWQLLIQFAEARGSGSTTLDF